MDYLRRRHRVWPALWIRSNPPWISFQYDTLSLRWIHLAFKINPTWPHLIALQRVPLLPTAPSPDQPTRVANHSPPAAAHQPPNIASCTKSPVPTQISQRSPLPTNSSPHQFKHSIQAPQEYMHTRSKRGIVGPKKHFNLLTTVPISPLPHSYRGALKDPNCARESLWVKSRFFMFLQLANLLTFSLKVFHQHYFTNFAAV
jgi:hypothetical protein